MEMAYLIWICIACIAAIPLSVESKSEEECGGIDVDLITGFPNINSLHQLDKKCVKYTNFFQCLNTTGDLVKSIPLMAKKLLTDYICQNKEDYMRSNDCFLSGANERVKIMCTRKYDIFKCGACRKMSQCAYEMVKGFGRCTVADAELKAVLTRLFFQPRIDRTRCSDTDECGTPTRKVKESITTISPKMSTTTKRTTMDNNSDVLKATNYDDSSLTTTATTVLSSEETTPSSTSMSETNYGKLPGTAMRTEVDYIASNSTTTHAASSLENTMENSKNNVGQSESSKGTGAKAITDSNGCPNCSIFNTASLLGIVFCAKMIY